jgi:hypothetical protein
MYKKLNDADLYGQFKNNNFWGESLMIYRGKSFTVKLD